MLKTLHLGGGWEEAKAQEVNFCPCCVVSTSQEMKCHYSSCFLKLAVFFSILCLLNLGCLKLSFVPAMTNICKN